MIYFDVHGTLFEYDYSTYTKSPPWFKEGSHCFANQTPLGNMQGLVRIMCDHFSDVKTLCKISVGTEDAKQEQRADTLQNLYKHYNFLNRDSLLFCDKDKNIAVSEGGVLLRSNILFDDYQPNLDKWSEAGGTSIKVLNGVNSANSKQLCISAFDAPTRILKEITDYLKVCG